MSLSAWSVSIAGSATEENMAVLLVCARFSCGVYLFSETGTAEIYTKEREI